MSNKTTQFQTNINLFSNNISKLTNIVHKDIILELMKSDKINEEPYKFEYTVLHKLNNGIETVNLLILNFLNKPQFLDSICILLRTLLLDVITLDFVYTNSAGKQEKYLEQIQNVYYDHIKFTIKNIKDFGSLYEDSQKEINEKIEQLKKQKNEYYDINQEPLAHLKGLKSCYVMVKEIKEQTSSNYSLNFLILAYEHYDIFSKYEHLGDLTLQLTHRGYQDESIERILTEIQTSIIVIIHYQSFLINSLSESKVKTVSEYEILKEKLNKIRLCG